MKTEAEVRAMKNRFLMMTNKIATVLKESVIEEISKGGTFDRFILTERIIKIKASVNHFYPALCWVLDEASEEKVKEAREALGDDSLSTLEDFIVICEKYAEDTIQLIEKISKKEKVCES